jgi:hypothetical protein
LGSAFTPIGPGVFFPAMLNSRRLNPSCLLVVLSLALAASCQPPDDPSPAGQAPEKTEQALASDSFVDYKPTFLGVYRPGGFPGGEVPLTLLSGTESDFLAWLANVKNLGANGYHIHSITSHVINGQLRFSGVWWPGRRDQYVTFGSNDALFSQQYTTLTNQGWRVQQIATSAIGSTTYYSAILEKGSYAHVPGLSRTRAQFDADVPFWAGRGYRLMCLSTNMLNGEVRYTGVYVPSTVAQEVVHSMTATDFHWEVERQRSRGMYLNVVGTHVLNDVVRHTGVFNGFGGNAYISFGQPEDGFWATMSSEQGKGSSISQLLVSHVEGLAINRVADQLKRSLEGVSTGAAITVRSSTSVSWASSGLRRTAANSPSRPATTAARTNSASVTKTLTAIAVMQLLARKRLSVDASVQPYLPQAWRSAPDVNTLTFRMLLQHTSGYAQVGANPGASTSYATMASMVMAGRGGAGPFGRVYFNPNYGLFRIIIPFLDGFSEAGVSDMATATANYYLNYMNTRVMTPSGSAPTTAKPASVEPTLFYPWPAGSVSGVNSGDQTTRTGGAYLELSADDITKVLLARANGTLLTASSRDTMDQNALGWDAVNQPVRHGTFSSKGGWMGCGINGHPTCGLHTVAISYSNNVHLGLVVNSGINGLANNGDYLSAALSNAYNTAWVPAY